MWNGLKMKAEWVAKAMEIFFENPPALIEFKFKFCVKLKVNNMFINLGSLVTIDRVDPRSLQGHPFRGLSATPNCRTFRRFLVLFAHMSFEAFL